MLIISKIFNVIFNVFQKNSAIKSIDSHDSILITPPYINKFINENEKKTIWMRAKLTRHFEWVVVYQDVRGDFFNIWITVFEKGKLVKTMPMHLSLFNNVITILDIKILGHYRSKGYGEIFLNELFYILENLHINKIEGMAERPEDSNLINFYKKFGISIIDKYIHWEK